MIDSANAEYAWYRCKGFAVTECSLIESAIKRMIQPLLV